MVLKTIRIFCQSRPRAFRLNGSFENLNLLVYLSQQKVRLGNHKKGYQFFFLLEWAYTVYGKSENTYKLVNYIVLHI